MSSGAERLAADVRAPIDRVTPNDFGVRKFTSGTGHAANVVPTEWRGRFVTLYASGPVHFAFSAHDDAEVDRSVSPTAAGAAIGVGGLLTTVPRSMRLPTVQPGQELYFVRESDESETVWMELSSSER